MGYVTSGTSVPYWVVAGEGLESRQTGERAQRSIALAYLDCDVVEDDVVAVDVRGTRVPALVVPFHLRSDAPPFARPIVYDHALPAVDLPAGEPPPRRGGCSARRWPTRPGVRPSASISSPRR